MPPKRKAKQPEHSVDPSLATTVQDDAPPPPAAGPSKRAKTTTGGKGKSTPAISAERKEANRLAAERSRVRRATRANILEQTAKGLAEENLVLKERIKKLVAMGVSVDGGGDTSVVDNASSQAVRQAEVGSESLRKRSTPVGVDTTANAHDLSAPVTEFPPPILRTGKSSLHQEMELHFRQQIDELRTLLHEKSEHLADGNTSQDPVRDLATQRQQIQDTNARLVHEIERLRDAISRMRADHVRAKGVTERLRARVREAEGQLIVKDGAARTAGDAAFKIDESRSDVQRAFKDLKRHLGLLIGHFNPVFVEPDLPEQEAFVVPAPYESAPLPEPQKRGRPPLSKLKASSSRSTRKYSTGASVSPAGHELPLHDTADTGSSSGAGPGKSSSRSKKRYEPSKVRYRLDADPDVIYIEEREIIQNEDGEQEVVHISKKPVYNPRPRSGAGRKPGGKGKEKQAAVTPMEDELPGGEREVEREAMVDPGLPG